MRASSPRAGRRGSLLVAVIGALLLGLPAPLVVASRNFSTVVIDAGHGGFDPGGIPGQRVPEKMMALDVSQRLARKLRDAGYHVIMTRDSDVFVPLGERVRIANRYGDAVFICIHFNSATRLNANGIETYYYRGDSASLAQSIHRNVLSDAPSENRGIRRRGFYVLRRTAVPSVLVECGFLTNPAEGGLAQTIAYRQRLAEQIARGIRREPAANVRPITASLRNYSLGNDFVRVPPETRSSRRSKSSRRSRHHTSGRKKTSGEESDTPRKKTRKKKSED